MAAFTGVEAVFCWVGYLAGCGWRGLAGAGDLTGKLIFVPGTEVSLFIELW